MRMIEVGVYRINLDNLAYAKATSAGHGDDAASGEVEVHFIGMPYALKSHGSTRV